MTSPNELLDVKTVTSVSIKPTSKNVVSWGGRIERTMRCYELRWTISREGWQDIDRVRSFETMRATLVWATEHLETAA